MTVSRDVFDLQAEWQQRIKAGAHSARGARVLTVCGPSGSGKTTVVRQLQERYPAYIESTAGNPHLKALLKGSPDFDATANQQWFLHRIAGYISTAKPELPLVLDQDPAAIVFVYSRMFCDAGLISEGQYRALAEGLLEIESSLDYWTAPRSVLCLDAPAEILRRRILQRSTESEAVAPPLQWFASVRKRFQDLFDKMPNAAVISTSEVGPTDVFSRACQIIDAT